MYASALRSETISPAEPRRQRADGRVALTVAGGSFATRAVRVAESGSLRVRMPRVPGPTLEAVLINTAGGIACGDRFAIDVDAGPGAQVTLATPAAERVYRSDGATADLAVRLELGAGADVAWLPQETILFDRARVRRRIEADLTGDASLLVFEAVVFGREARGEEVSEGFFEDRWRIRRGRASRLCRHAAARRSDRRPARPAAPSPPARGRSRPASTSPPTPRAGSRRPERS